MLVLVSAQVPTHSPKPFWVASKLSFHGAPGFARATSDAPCIIWLPVRVIMALDCFGGVMNFGDPNLQAESNPMAYDTWITCLVGYSVWVNKWISEWMSTLAHLWHIPAWERKETRKTRRSTGMQSDGRENCASLNTPLIWVPSTLHGIELQLSFRQRQNHRL